MCLLPLQVLGEKEQQISNLACKLALAEDALAAHSQQLDEERARRMMAERKVRTAVKELRALGGQNVINTLTDGRPLNGQAGKAVGETEEGGDQEEGGRKLLAGREALDESSGDVEDGRRERESGWESEGGDEEGYHGEGHMGEGLAGFPAITEGDKRGSDHSKGGFHDRSLATSSGEEIVLRVKTEERDVILEEDVPAIAPHDDTAPDGALRGGGEVASVAAAGMQSPAGMPEQAAGGAAAAAAAAATSATAFGWGVGWLGKHVQMLQAQPTPPHFARHHSAVSNSSSNAGGHGGVNASGSGYDSRGGRGTWDGATDHAAAVGGGMTVGGVVSVGDVRERERLRREVKRLQEQLVEAEAAAEEARAEMHVALSKAEAAALQVRRTSSGLTDVKHPDKTLIVGWCDFWKLWLSKKRSLDVE